MKQAVIQLILVRMLNVSILIRMLRLLQQVMIMTRLRVKLTLQDPFRILTEHGPKVTTLTLVIMTESTQ